MQNKSEEIISFLKKRPLIKINGLEKICKITPSSLSKTINRGHQINEKYIQALEKELKKYGLMLNQKNT